MKLFSLLVVKLLIGAALSYESYGIQYHYNGNSKIGEEILNLIDLNDSCPASKIIEYKRFFDEMVEHDGMHSIAGTILGYKVDQLHSEVVENQRLDEIIKKLIPEIKDMPWNMTVALYNMNEKYLCSSDDQYAEEATYYQVHFQNLNDNCYWKLNIEANGRYFTIQNRVNNRYLFAAANRFALDSDRRRIFTTSNVSRIVDQSDTWQFEPVRNEVMMYRIKNLGWDEYMHSNSNKTDVVTWKPLGCFGTNCHWKIEAAPNHELPIERQNFLLEYYTGYQGKESIAKILLKHAVNSSTQILEYRILYDLMNENDGLYSTSAMTLDYNIQKLQKHHSSDENLGYIEKNLRNHFAIFPWNSRILINNGYFGGHFLCPYNETFKNTNYQTIELLRDNLMCQWQIEVGSDGEWFRLKSFTTDKYLFAAANKYSVDSVARRVFMINDDGDSNSNLMSLWQFEHTRKPGFVRIKNAYWDEYLTNVYYHGVYTNRKFGCDVKSCFWRIIDADVS